MFARKSQETFETITMYKVCVVQDDGFQYGLKVCSTG